MLKDIDTWNKRSIGTTRGF